MRELNGVSATIENNGVIVAKKKSENGNGELYCVMYLMLVTIVYLLTSLYLLE